MSNDRVIPVNMSSTDVKDALTRLREWKAKHPNGPYTLATLKEALGADMMVEKEGAVHITLKKE